MAKVLFFRCTNSQYIGLASKNPDALYFLEDTKQLYLGTVNITERLLFVDAWELSDLPVLGKFYLNVHTGEFKCCEATGLRTIVPSITANASDFDDVTKRDYIASISAIKDYVQSKIHSSATYGISSLEFNSTSGEIEAKKDDATDTTLLRGVAHHLNYNNLIITIPVYGSDDIVINLPKDNFVRSGRYEHDYPLPNPPGGHGPAIVLTVGDGEQSNEVVVPAATIVNVYLGGSTDTVNVSIDNNTNVITASVKLSQDAKNAIQLTSNGLLVDGSTYATKPEGLTLGEVVVSDGQNGFSKSSVYISSQDLKSGYLATGDIIAQAIAQAISSAFDSIEEKVNQLDDRLPNVENDQLIIGQANRHVSSGKVAGGSVLQSSPSINVIATELAAKTAIDDAKMLWDVMEKGYPGFRQVGLSSYRTTYRILYPNIANNYPPSNLFDNNLSTAYYWPSDNNTTGEIKIKWNEDCPYGAGFIFEVTYVAGPGGISVCSNDEPDTGIYLFTRNVGGSTQTVGLGGGLNQKQLYQKCIDNGGFYKVVTTRYAGSNQQWRTRSSEPGFYIGRGGEGQLGLGVAEIKFYIQVI